MSKTEIPITRPARTFPDWGPDSRHDPREGAIAGQSQSAGPLPFPVPASDELHVVRGRFGGFAVVDPLCMGDQGQQLIAFAGGLDDCLTYLEDAMRPRTEVQL